MALIGRSLEKHMRRNPIPDDDIRGSLLWAQEMIAGILSGDAVEVPAELADAVPADDARFADGDAPLVIPDDFVAAFEPAPLESVENA